MNDTSDQSQAAPTAVSRAIELATDVEKFPLSKCGPSDDPDEQTAYLYGFLDVVRPFVAAIKRIGDPDLSEQVSGLVLDIVEITEAYTLKADLQGVIDHLREFAADPTYSASIKANAAFLEPSVLAALRGVKSEKFDFTKLIRLCEELNDAYGRGNYLSCVLLIRAAMNHMPPVFGRRTFAEVVAHSARARRRCSSVSKTAHARLRTCTRTRSFARESLYPRNTRWNRTRRALSCSSRK